MLQIQKASAGSGKTFTLTREYIKFLIAHKGDDGRYRLHPHPNCEHSRILAITFTNKATNEMTRRIIKDLALLAAMPSDAERARLAADEIDVNDPLALTLSSPYAKDFLDPETGLGCTAQELQDACRTALTNLLYDYSFFNVSTIDSFFQSVLRMFTREVDLPDNYNVELDNTLAITIGVEELFRNINNYTIPDTPEDVERRWICDWLYRFMRSKMVSGNKFNLFSRNSDLFNTVVQTLKNITGEDFKRRYNVLASYLGDYGRLKAFENSITNVIGKGLDTLAPKAGALMSSYPKEFFNSNFYNNLDSISRGQPLSSAKTIIKVSENPESATTVKSKKAYNPGPDFYDSSQAVAREYVAYQDVVNELRPLASQIYIFGLISAVMKNIQDYCLENNLILLNETNNILQGLINDDETPFIYEKLGYYLDHLLIDEFQDTSPMQWENLRALVMESLGRGRDNLVIGDEKQCIYRFRNSDPRLLGSGVEADVLERFRSPAMIDLKGHEIKDNSNWRSAPEIVRFNNSLFTALARIVDGEKHLDGVLSATETYANIIQQISSRRKAPAGYVKVYFESDSEENTVFKLLALEIKRQLQAGYKPGEIAILVERHTQGRDIIFYLLDAMVNGKLGLPRFDIVSDDSMELGQSRALRLIIGVLKLVNMPEFLEPDKTSVADATGTERPEKRESMAYRRHRLVNRYQFYLHRTHVDGSPYTCTEALDAALVDNRTPEDGFEIANFDDIKRLVETPCMEITTLVDRLIHDFVPSSLKESENLFITSFMDKVVEISANGKQSIQDLLSWWNKSGCKIRLSIPPSEQALTVMTIHKAKGLEFPCVHVPFVSERLISSVGWVDLPRERFAEFGIDPDIVPPAMPIRMDESTASSRLYGASCRDNIAQSKVDKLNVDYVAFTRATRELVVYALNVKDKNTRGLLLDGVNAVTEQYLDDLELDADTRAWVTPLADKLTAGVFEYGSPTAPNVVESTTSSTAGITGPNIIQKYDTQGNVEHIHARTSSDDVEPLEIDNPRHLGNFCHEVMSRVRVPDDLSLSMRRSAYRYQVDGDIAAVLQRRLERALNNPLSHRWFDGTARVVAERQLTIGDDSRRPDRVMLYPDGSVEVIDYKFVDSLPADLEHDARHRHYLWQVRRYCRAVKDYSTRGWVKGYIWYIAPDDNLIVQA